MWTKEMTLGLISAFIAALASPPTNNKCQRTLVVNHTEKWTESDQRALKRAQNRCVEIYPDAPCLKRFDKLGALRYTAKCAATRN